MTQSLSDGVLDAIANNPAHVGTWLVRQILTWIVKHTMTRSRWTYGTSGGATLTGSVPLGELPVAINVGPAGGLLWFSRDREEVTLKYLMVGLGLGISPPQQLLTLAVSLPAMPSRGSLRLFPGMSDFATPADFTAPGMGILGPCAVLNIDLQLIAGYYGSVMLLGLSPWAKKLFERLSIHYGELMGILREESSGDIFRRAWDVQVRTMRTGYTLAQLHIDIQSIMELFRTGLAFRAALFMEGIEGSASFPMGATASASITYYGGVITPAPKEVILKSLKQLVPGHASGGW